MVLSGSRVLVVEDEALIAIDISSALAAAGAEVVIATTLKQALQFVREQCLAAAIIDHRLPDGDSDPLRDRLLALGVPCVVCSGSRLPDPSCVQFSKPVDPEVLVSALERLLRADARECA